MVWKLSKWTPLKVVFYHGVFLEVHFVRIIQALFLKRMNHTLTTAHYLLLIFVHINYLNSVQES